MTNVGTHDSDSDYAYGQTACPAGTYNFVDGSESDSDCLECPAGSLCEQKPATNTAAYKIVPCPAGKYCLKGSSSTEDCLAGYYCPEGTNYPIPCPSGTYGSVTGLSESTCEGPCQQGYYCTQILEYGLRYNPVATFPCINNLYYCNSFADPSCSNNDEQLDLRCKRGASTATMQECPAGHYCPTGSGFPVACPTGTYNPDVQKYLLTDCLDCTGGQFCPTMGLTSPGSPCASGYFCPDGSDQKEAEPCPAGNQCPAGSSAPTPCNPGEYQANEMQFSCEDCPSGYYCDASEMTTPTICPPGYFCPGPGET